MVHSQHDKTNRDAIGDAVSGLELVFSLYHKLYQNPKSVRRILYEAKHYVTNSF